MSTIIVREAAAADCHAMTRVRLAAFDGAPLMLWLGGRDVNLHAHHQREMLLRGHKRFYVAVDTARQGPDEADAADGRIVGVMVFSRESNNMEASDAHQISYLQWLEASIVSLELKAFVWWRYLSDRQRSHEQDRKVEILTAALSDGKQRELKDKGIHDYIDLSILTVDPSCQGKGVGKKLLRVAFERAKREAVPVWLESTKAGYPVYLKTGFKDTGCMMVIKDGDELIEEIPGMVWKPEENP